MSRLATVAKSGCVAFALCALLMVGSSMTFAQDATQNGQAYALSDLVARALKGHPLLQAAQADEDVFAAKLYRARWAWVPRGKVTSLLAPLPRQTEEGTFYDEWGPYTRNELTVAMPLYTFGKWESLKALGRAGVSAAQARKEIAENVVRRYVYGAYTALVFARTTLEVFKDGRKYLDRAQKRLEVLDEDDDDSYDPTDRLRLKIVRAEVDDREAQVRGLVQNMEDALRQLASLDQSDPVLLVDSKLAAPAMAPPELPRCLELARVNRPEMQALNAGIRASKAAHGLARSMWFPTLSLVAKQIIARAPTADDPASVFANDPYNHIGGGGGLALSWDLDVIGRVAEVDEAAAKVRKIEAQRTAAQMGIELEVRKLHQDYERQLERVKGAKGAFRAARGWLTAKADLFDAGFVGYGDVSDAVTAYYERKVKDLEARYRSLQAQADMSLALGLTIEELEQAVGGSSPVTEEKKNPAGGE